MDITKLYQTQISLTEWLEAINHRDAHAMRIEDNEKRERLKVLNALIGLPYDKPTQFKATDITNETDNFKTFIATNGHQLCALRLIPLDPSLPKLRMRGHKVHDALKWFHQQTIDPLLYKADFVPHSEKNIWSTIFVVNPNGIFGEIIRGGHHQLTQGFYDSSQPISFSFNGKTWHLTPKNQAAQKHLAQIATFLKIADRAVRTKLQKKFGAEFNQNNYLQGYFETVTTREHGIWFIDYNRLLGQLYETFNISEAPLSSAKLDIHGRIGSHGKIVGKVRIITKDQIAKASLESNEILVCVMTTPEYVPLMRQAGGVITDLGGILSHAAIVSRELGKPCIVGTKIATQVLKDGDQIELDAHKGRVRKIKISSKK